MHGKMPRVTLLEEAIKITAGDRNVAHGNPEDTFQNIADYWNAYLTQARKAATMLNSQRLTSQDVAHMMILMKMARLATNPGHRDSLVDVAGYAACAEECRVAASAGGKIADSVPAGGQLIPSRYLVDPLSKTVTKLCDSASC